jgi:3-methylcrotonyl-CoA carboxylase alpha subunit
MIAKLIVWDENRAAALARLRTALDEYRIVGVANNIAFLQRLAASAAFTSADLDTALIEREHDHLFPPAEVPPRDAWLAAAVATLLRTHAASDASPWSSIDGWRLGGSAERDVTLRFGDTGKTIAVQYRGGDWTLRLDGVSVMASAVAIDDAM